MAGLGYRFQEDASGSAIGRMGVRPNNMLFLIKATWAGGEGEGKRKKTNEGSSAFTVVAGRVIVASSRGGIPFASVPRRADIHNMARVAAALIGLGTNRRLCRWLRGGLMRREVGWLERWLVSRHMRCGRFGRGHGEHAEHEKNSLKKDDRAHFCLKIRN